ncbi:MAG: hypothetical protein ACLSBB_15550 [Ruthenibacterium lactatiformans]
MKYGFIGPDSRVYRNWYNGIKTLLEASTGVNPYTGKADPVARALYDFTYQAIRGTYSPQPYRTSLEPDVSSDDSSGGPASSSASSGISSSGAPSSGCSSAPHRSGQRHVILRRKRSIRRQRSSDRRLRASVSVEPCRNIVRGNAHTAFAP